MKKLLLATVMVSVAGCSETVYNASPSIFPPIEGPVSLPSQASGFYQGRADEFLIQLSDNEQVVWDRLTPSERARVALYLKNGGTLTSALQDDELLPGVRARLKTCKRFLGVWSCA